jgi:hypothetical protein
MFSNLALLAGAALALAGLGHAASSKAGSTMDVDGIFYYVPSTPVSRLEATSDQLKTATTNGEDLIPFTVITDNASIFSTSTLQSIVTSFAADDDVFSSGFLQGVSHMFLNDLLNKRNGDLTVKAQRSTFKESLQPKFKTSQRVLQTLEQNCSWSLVRQAAQSIFHLGLTSFMHTQVIFSRLGACTLMLMALSLRE